MAVPSCCLCHVPMKSAMTPWCFRCSRCGTWASDLEPGINGDDHERLDEDLREISLSRLRQQNNWIVLDRLQQLGLPADGALLDVGAAPRLVRRRGRGAGAARAGRGARSRRRRAGAARLDPVRLLPRRPRRGRAVRRDLLQRRARAHPRRPQRRRGVAQAPQARRPAQHQHPQQRRARPPGRRGVAPGGARWAVQPGLAGGLSVTARLVLRRGPLRELCAAEGLEPVFAGRLPSISRSGLWQRAHEDRRPSVATVVGFATAWLGAPVLNSPALSDIMHIVARQPAS